MAENSRFGREPIQVVRVDQDFCNLTYGEPPTPESSLGNEQSEPNALISSNGEWVAFKDGAPFLTFNDSDGNESLYLNTGKPSAGVQNAYDLNQSFCEQLLTEGIASGAITLECDMQFIPGNTGTAYLISFGNSLGDLLEMRVTLSASGSDIIATLSGSASDAGTNLVNGSPGNAIIGTTGNFEDRVHHFAVVFVDQPGNVNLKTYINGAFIGELSGPSNGSLQVKTLMQGTIGAAWGNTTTARNIRVSNVRMWTVERSASEINSNKYLPILGSASGLQGNFIFDHASIGTGQPGCNASKNTNLITYSENLDLSNLFSYSFLREGTTTEDGTVFQILTIPDGTGGEFSTNEIDFLVLEGKQAKFSVRFKKTSYSGTVQLDLLTDAEGGFGTVTGQNSVSVESDTGAFIAIVETGFFETDYTITDQGDYVLVELTAVNSDPDEVDGSSFFAGLSLSASEGDSILLGEIQLGLSEQTQGYSKTTFNPKEPTGTQECFNTRSTCQDPENYDKGVLPLKFITDRTPIPTDDYYIPSIKSVRVTPAKLNPGGADRNARALGQRASINVSFQDHPHNDRVVDLYRSERDYNPEERGTFWTKWRARNPYYMQRPIQLISGYLKDGQIVEPITRDFVITGFSGPDASGNVTISGKDVLTLAEDEKAQAPVASSGKLSADLTAGATSATLTPAGIGDSEYPASGFVRVGKEVMAFTRSSDTLTLTRGQFGTDADDHDEDDTVQLCLRYVSEAPQDILYDLLLNYANIPAIYLDKAQWDAEALDFLPRLYTAIITEPNGVSKLISEMCQQMYFTIWWDERLGKVLLKSVRLAQEDEVFELDDNEHLIADSISWTDLSDELITQVWVYYGQIDPTDKLDQGSNYSTIAITADPSAEGEDKHNLRRIKTIFSRWIDATNASAAEDLGRRILDRYGNAPRQVTFRVDAKDDYLWLADYIRITNRLRVDQFGLPTAVNLQIFQAEEKSLGSEYQYTAQEFIPALESDVIGDPNERVIPITSDLLNVNLRALHDALFGVPSGTETVTFVLREGVTIGGDTAGGGVNVPYGQRNDANDIYDAGVSNEFGVAMGTFPILQRASISSVRNTGAGASYTEVPAGSGTADYLIREYPISLAVTTGSWPSGVTLKLIIEAGARILGEGGNGSGHYVQDGGDFGVTTGAGAASGGDGGDALEVLYDLEITNGGIIGGGGGGGSMCAVLAGGAGQAFSYICGGGGAGLEISDISTNRFRTGPNGTQATASPPFAIREPASGTQTIAGRGGRAVYSDQFSNAQYIGGNGGSLGGAGGDSSFFNFTNTGLTTNTTEGTPGTGGLAGKAIRSGANLVTYVNRGDVRGQEVS